MLKQHKNLLLKGMPIPITPHNSLGPQGANLYAICHNKSDLDHSVKRILDDLSTKMFLEHFATNYK